MAKLAADDPRTIGGYRLLGRLGAGGMGRVYLARSDRGRTVAVKLVQEALAQQQEFRARFRQEVQAALKVGGEWTAPVLDADTEAATPWVATGYIAGPSLDQVVAKEYGPLPERSVVLLAAGLVRALRSIHAAGLIHRDMKPSNVLLTIDRPRVIDFGISRALEAAENDGLTRAGSVLGSPSFMAPEQVMGHQLSAATDVFCLGAVLAYAATGQQPFGAPDMEPHAVLYRIAHQEPELSNLPAGLHQLIGACLSKDPEWRPTLDQLLAYVPGTDGEGGLDVQGEPWLPGALVAKLGRHAVELLDTENPETGGIPKVTRADAAAGAGAGAAPGGTGPGPVAGAGTAVGAGAAGVAGSAGAAGTGRAAGADGTDPYGAPGAHAAFAQGAPDPGPTAVGGTPPHGAYGMQDQYGTQDQYGRHGPYGGPANPPPPQPGSAHPGDHGRGRGAPARGGSRVVKAVLSALALLLVAGGTFAVLKALTGPGEGDGGGGAPAGSVPRKYVGTWTRAQQPNGQKGQIKIIQNKVGRHVATMTAAGPGYHCVFQAKLAAKGTPVKLGPSRVINARSRGSCTDAEPTTLQIVQDRLVRKHRDGTPFQKYQHAG